MQLGFLQVKFIFFCIDKYILFFYLGEDLTPVEKAKLNELCILDLEKELRLKSGQESKHIWEISKLKADLQRCKIMLEQSKAVQKKAKAALLESTPENPKKRSQDKPDLVKSAKKAKKEVIVISGIENEGRSTRSRSSRLSKGIVKLDKAMPDNPFESGVKKVSLSHVSVTCESGFN